jgi:hypothetical protein
MPGGLLNLVSIGGQNVIFNGNPQKTFWTSTFKSYTNFGIQNFRLDYEGLRQINMSTDSVFTFKVKRYADLLMDTYLVMTLPDIYSPILPPTCPTNDDTSGTWQPYEFKWIKNLGAMMIRTIKFTVGGNLIQSMTGYDMVALANRDLAGTKKAKWDAMTGNTVDMYDPANAFGRSDIYPNAVYDSGRSEPSIRGREIYVPIPIWWSLNSQQAFPLVCLQYNELQIEVTMRPMRELFQVRDVTDPINNYPVVAPNFNVAEFQFYRFIQPPPNPSLVYTDFTTSWYENMHLSSNFCFLSEEETVVFASTSRNYLIRELHDSWFFNVSTTDKAWLQNSTAMVLGWMMMFQRSDVNLRNEWSNFTNWPYDYLPYNIALLPANLTEGESPCSIQFTADDGTEITSMGYGVNPNGTYTLLSGTGPYEYDNTKEILLTLGIYFDGTMREEVRSRNVYKYEQQYKASEGYGAVQLAGLYCYNFCLNTSPYVLQPSGAMNLSKYSKIELDFTTIQPLINPDASVFVICDPESGASLGTRKTAAFYEYTYNFLVVEERYNVLTFVGGNASLMNAR